MSVVRYKRLACQRCGQGVECKLYKSLHVSRVPHARAQLLAGWLHRQTCLHCGECFQVDASFFYFDAARSIALLVLPATFASHTQDLAEEARGGAQLRALLPLLQDRSQVDVAAMRYGVVAGLADARERILVWEANLDWQEVAQKKRHLPAWLSQANDMTLLGVEGDTLYYARVNAVRGDHQPLICKLVIGTPMAAQGNDAQGALGGIVVERQRGVC